MREEKIIKNGKKEKRRERGKWREIPKNQTSEEKDSSVRLISRVLLSPPTKTSTTSFFQPSTRTNGTTTPYQHQQESSQFKASYLSARICSEYFPRSNFALYSKTIYVFHKIVLSLVLSHSLCRSLSLTLLLT